MRRRVHPELLTLTQGISGRRRHVGPAEEHIAVEGLDEEALQNRLTSLAKTAETAGKAANTVSRVYESVKNFFGSVGNFFSKIFGGKKN